MSKIIDPTTGAPVGQDEVIAQIGQIILAVQQLHARLEGLIAHQAHTGLFIEYMVNKINDAVDEDGNPIVDLDLDSFPEWAEKRSKEIQELAREELAKQAQAQAGAIKLDE